MRLSSRRYLKRVWRVPKPATNLPQHVVKAEERLGTLVLKLLRKHGWPAVLVLDREPGSLDGFAIHHDTAGPDGPDDFVNAVGIAVRIIAAMYRVEVSEYRGSVALDRLYHVTPQGTFKEIAPLRSV